MAEARAAGILLELHLPSFFAKSHPLMESGADCYVRLLRQAKWID